MLLLLAQSAYEVGNLAQVLPGTCLSWGRFSWRLGDGGLFSGLADLDGGILALPLISWSLNPHFIDNARTLRNNTKLQDTFIQHVRCLDQCHSLNTVSSTSFLYHSQLMWCSITCLTKERFRCLYDGEGFSGLANGGILALTLITWSLGALGLISNDGNTCIVHARMHHRGFRVWNI